MEELITCVICSNIMEEPRMLSCQHTCCHRCLVQMIRYSALLTCPVCRFEMVFDDSLSPDEKIQQIPINRFVQGFLDNVLKVSERCLKHDGNEFIYYCSNHRKLACQDCILKDCKKCHEKNCIKSVRDVAASPKFKSDVLNQRKDLARLEETLKQTANRLKKNSDQMETDREFISQKVNQFEEKAVNMIRTFKENVLRDLEQKKLSEINRIEYTRGKCERFQTETSQLIKALNLAKAQRAVSQIDVYLSNEDKMRSFSNTLENDIGSVPQTVLSKDFDSILVHMQTKLQCDVKVTKFAWS